MARTARASPWNGTWVTTEQDKFWGNMWGGTGIAFGQPWPTIDITGARHLVFWAKISEAGTETELGVRMDCATKDKGSIRRARSTSLPMPKGRRLAPSGRVRRARQRVPESGQDRCYAAEDYRFQPARQVPREQADVPAYRQHLFHGRRHGHPCRQSGIHPSGQRDRYTGTRTGAEDRQVRDQGRRQRSQERRWFAAQSPTPAREGHAQGGDHRDWRQGKVQSRLGPDQSRSGGASQRDRTARRQTQSQDLEVLQRDEFRPR